MPIPINIPNSEVVFLLLAVGALLIGFTSIGALFRIWSWKVPRGLAYAFFGVLLAYIVIAYVIGNVFAS